MNEHVERSRRVSKELIGAGIGLLISILLLSLGFLKTLLIIVCVLLGYFVGKRTERG